VTITIGSLFSGIGGLEMALQAAGCGPVLWHCDSDPMARAVLGIRYPGAPIFDDVRNIDATTPAPDLICGGFPCQDISFAGIGAGIEGERSGLWKECARIVRVLRPRLVFIENVAALAARGLDRVLADLAGLGFDAEWDVFRASDVGAPHRRDRLFILAHAHGVGSKEIRRLGPLDPNRAARGRHADGRRVADARFPPTRDRIDGWLGPQPEVRRGTDGIPNRVALRLLGNAVVPAQAILAFRSLAARAAA